MFQTALGSAWQHPGMAFVGGVLVLALCAGRAHRRGRLALLLLLEAEILVDALFTGALSPLPQSSAAFERASVLFVILGDARFFYLVARQRMAWPRALGLGLALALLVPATSFGLKVAVPGLLDEPTRLFLFYEAVFALLAALAFSAIRRGGLALSPGQRRFVLRLCAFEVVQYALWALADALILEGRDAGYGLRFVPNALYYVAFVPLAVLAAPAAGPKEDSP